MYLYRVGCMFGYNFKSNRSINHTNHSSTLDLIFKLLILLPIGKVGSGWDRTLDSCFNDIDITTRLLPTVVTKKQTFVLIEKAALKQVG